MEHPTTTASPGKILSWTLFDFANTGFYVIIITLVFPVYFQDVIAGGNEAYWGRTLSASMLITALLGPLLGSIADATNRKKIFLGFFTGACVAATVGLYFTGEGTLWMAVILLVIANVGFEGGTIFYDAFLPEIASEKDYGKISGYGFAMGYLGSFLTLVAILPIIGDAPKVTFLMAAGIFALFSLPLFLFIHERRAGEGLAQGNMLVAGYRRLRETLSDLRRFDAVKRFLLAYFVYNDSILTVILFAGIFAKTTLGMSDEERIYFFLLVQGAALLGSLGFGALTNVVGARQTIAMALVIWIGVVVAAYFVDSKDVFMIIGGMAGIALGASQSTSRAMMALITPYEKKTEFFGFYDGFFGKASAVIGPLVFGEIAAIYGQRPAMLVIGVMLVAGIALLFRVPDVRAHTA